jgi:hypothetical protein
MLWIILLVIVIVVAFGTAGLRLALRLAGAVALLCIILILGYLGYNSLAKGAAKGRIGASEVEFDDLRLSISTSGKLTGTVRNLSKQYTLRGAELQITIRDCFQSRCDVVGQDTTTLYGLRVPPGQVRAVDQYVFFSGLPTARGAYQWDYRIESLEGTR